MTIASTDVLKQCQRRRAEVSRKLWSGYGSRIGDVDGTVVSMERDNECRECLLRSQQRRWDKMGGMKQLM
jgi:hypothetical protein